MSPHPVKLFDLPPSLSNHNTHTLILFPHLDPITISCVVTHTMGRMGGGDLERAGGKREKGKEPNEPRTHRVKDGLMIVHHHAHMGYVWMREKRGLSHGWLKGSAV